MSEWEIVVVPNGCTDNTASVAGEALRSAIPALTCVNVTHSVRVLTQGGKSNTWNHYIHEMSRKGADVIVMIDTDIEFGHADTIFNCLAELRSNAHPGGHPNSPTHGHLKFPHPDRASMRR